MRSMRECWAPFNLCESCHEIESAKTGLNKTLHQVHCDRIREEAAYHLGGGGSSGVKRVLSISQEGLTKGNSESCRENNF